MKSNLSPAIWLIVLIVGLPQLSETVYTPSLPDIAHALRTEVAMIEYTLTIYLFGFAVGSLVWGKVSDQLGRKPCVMMGLAIFIIGCTGCYFSSSIEMLMASRLIQAFGGSIGSVLGQAICRDAFHGPALGRVYSAVSSALALFPALGPPIGGIIAEMLGWRNIFIFLALFTIFLAFIILAKLPETLPSGSRKNVGMWTIAKLFIQDRKIIGLGIVVGGCNGLMFSYFAEGPFYLINKLGLSPSDYGSSFIIIALSTMMGGLTSKKLQKNDSSEQIMGYGLTTIMLATTAFSLAALVNAYVTPLNAYLMILATILCQIGCAFGICMAVSNALALALVDYRHAVGTASSLFGFFYYCVISLLTFFMGFLHDGTLLPMPLYFFALSVFMMITNKIVLKENL